MSACSLAQDRKITTRLTDSRFFKPGCAPRRGRPRLGEEAHWVLEDFGYVFPSLPPPSRGVRWEDISGFEQANNGLIHVYVWEWMASNWLQRNYFERVLVREPCVTGTPAHKSSLVVAGGALHPDPQHGRVPELPRRTPWAGRRLPHALPCTCGAAPTLFSVAILTRHDRLWSFRRLGTTVNL